MGTEVSSTKRAGLVSTGLVLGLIWLLGACGADSADAPTGDVTKVLVVTTAER